MNGKMKSDQSAGSDSNISDRNMFNVKTVLGKLFLFSNYLRWYDYRGRHNTMQTYVGGQTNVSYYSNIFEYVNKCIVSAENIPRKSP